jgi:hypothetical protein
VNGNSVQTGGSTYTLSTTANGKYEVSVECGNKKAMNIYAVDCQFQIVVDTPANGALIFNGMGSFQCPVVLAILHGDLMLYLLRQSMWLHCLPIVVC